MKIDLEGNIEILLIQTIAVGLANIIIPFLFRRTYKLNFIVMLVISLLYLINVMSMASFYSDGGKVALIFAKFSDFEIKFAIEGMGLVFLLLLSGLWPIALTYTYGYLEATNETDRHRFFVFLNLCIMSASFIAISANLFTTFIFYEILTLSTIPLISHSGTDHAQRSVKRYMMILMTVSLMIFLPSIIAVHVKVGHTDFITQGILNGKVSDRFAQILFFTFLFGIAKIAMLPVHGWLPTAMVASYPVSAMLHAVAVVKTGLFVLYKIIAYIFGLEFLYNIFSGTMIHLIVPILTIFFGSISALRQDTIKKLLAYSTISQLSFALIGVLTFTKIGLVASVMHMISHSFSKLTLFYAAGSLYCGLQCNKTIELKGVARQMPLTFLFFTIGGISLIGIPPLAGFFSKYSLVGASMQSEYYIVILFTIILSTLITSSYIFQMIKLGHSYQETSHPQVSIPISMKIATGMSAALVLSFILFGKLINRLLINV